MHSCRTESKYQLRLHAVIDMLPPIRQLTLLDADFEQHATCGVSLEHNKS